MRTSSSGKPLVLITMGDPSGIGPEVIVKALADKRISRRAHLLVVGDRFILDKTKKLLRLNNAIPLIDLSNVRPGDFSYGKSRASFGKASMEYVDVALEILQQRGADAVVTAPLSKLSVRKAGFSAFKGHTEYLARNARTKTYAMMFVSPKLKVTLVTRHIPLKEVPQALDITIISRAIRLTQNSLKEFFGIRNPKIGVAGLNPHAGEEGLFGEEERRIIIPAIRSASRHARGVYGPVPPDVIFHEALNGKFDAVVALYHDQGLIPFKMLCFESGVNLTLGLPFIRTSPDHGTAFDIAGTGHADPTSMKEAILLACQLSETKMR